MAYTFKHGDRPLDGYTIQRGVGRGGFGEVYYALSDSGKEIALKYLRDNPQIELRGVGQCMNLKSPNLVAIYDVKQNDEGDNFVLMEYVAGPSLRDIMADGDGKLDVPRAVYFVREIAKGLAYLHDRGIVHRDLKPGNIFYEDGYVKIGDYGLSKFLSPSRHSAQTSSVGTVHYMAPEIGSGHYHRGTDIYALGVMLYEMLLGRVPFEGSSLGEILMKHLTAQPEVDALPAPFPAVIRKALAKDPLERYQTVHEMVADILGVDEIERSLAGFEPASLSTAARRVGERIAAAGPRTLSPSPGRAGSSAIDRLTGGVAQQAGRTVKRFRDDARERFQPVDIPVVITGRERVKRLVVMLVVASGLSCAAALLGMRMPGEQAVAFGIFTVFLVTFASVIGTLFLAPNLGVKNEWLERLVVVGCAAPFMLMFSQGFNVRITDDLLRAVMLTLLLVDWPKRARDGQRGKLRFESAITAGFCAWILGLIFGAHEATMIAGLVAAASLTTQAAGSLWPVVGVGAASKKDIGGVTGSSVVAAPIDAGGLPNEQTERSPKDDDDLFRHTAWGFAKRHFGSRDPVPEVATKAGSLTKWVLLAAFGTGALILFVVSGAENEPVVAACGAGCLVFAVAFNWPRVTDAADTMGRRAAAAAFVTGAIINFVLGIDEREDVLIAVAAGCMLFALVFGAEWLKSALHAVVGEFGFGPRARSSDRRRHALTFMLASATLFLIVLAADLRGDDADMSLLGAAVTGTAALGNEIALAWRRRKRRRTAGTPAPMSREGVGAERNQDVPVGRS